MRIEFRGKSLLVDGYVNAVGRDSRVLPSTRGDFVEQVVPGTFNKALKKAEDVQLLFNHNENRNLGSIKAGNLQLYEDSIGLRATATVTDEEVIAKAKKGELRGWSFSFTDNSPNWKTGENGIQKRYLEDINLFEVSILDMTPAYIATTIESRNQIDVLVESRGLPIEKTSDTTEEDDSEEEEEFDDSKEEEKDEKEEQRSIVERNAIFYAQKQLEILKTKGRM